MKKNTHTPEEGKTNKRGRKPAGRGKGTGTLERHGRTWRAVWTVDGVTFKRSTGTANKDKARDILAEFVQPYHTKSEAKKDAADAKRAKRAAFKEAAAVLDERARQRREDAGRVLVPLAEAWGRFNVSTKRRSVSPNVNRIYEKRWGVFLAWIKQNRPAARALLDVDAETADAFMREIRARSAPKTYNDYRALLSQVWRILDRDAGLDGFNPWHEIAALAKKTHTRRELNAEELARVVEPLEGEMRVLFALGIYTGLRLGDAVNLTWGAVDLVQGFIFWTPHKTEDAGTDVRIPLFPALAAILAETPAAKRRGKILPGLAEEYREHEKVLNAKIRRVFEAAGIETQAETDRANPKTKTKRKAVEVGFHSLRHTFVSLCGNAGVPLAIVQSIVGHTNERMTNKYFHVSDEALRAAVAPLPDVFPALPASAEAVEVEAVPDVDCAREAVEAFPCPRTGAREAVEAFKRACEGLKGAGLTKDDWREVSAALAAVEKARRA